MQINGDERRFAATHLLALRHKNDHTIASSVIWGFSFSLFFPSIKARTLFFFRCILTHSGSKQERIGTYELDYLPIYLPVYSNCSFNLAPHRLLHLYLFILSLTHSKAHRKVNDLISQHQSVFNHSATLYRILMDLRLLLCSELTPKVTWENVFIHVYHKSRYEKYLLSHEIDNGNQCMTHKLSG